MSARMRAEKMTNNLFNDGERDKVSIIVPVYNDEKYLRSCMDSILHQTYSNLEVILVDDSSKDASPAMCEEYARSDGRVRALHNEKNLGLSGSRERGYRSATGEWICFVDHDDCMHVQAIEKLLAAADEGTDIVTGKYKNVLNQYFEQHKWEEDEQPKVITLEQEDALNTLGDFEDMGVPSCLWSKLYRRELFGKVETQRYKEPFFLIYFEDTMLTPMLVKACRKLKIVDQCLYIHRIDYSSVSMSPGALEFNLQTARAADTVMKCLDVPYARRTYTRYMRDYLLVFSKNWYLVWRYYDKDPALLSEMEALFRQYYEIYEKQDERTFSVADLCIRLFRWNKALFCIVVCRVWFDCVARLRHRLLAR